MRLSVILALCGFSTLLAAETSDRKLAPLGVGSLLETAGGLLLVLALIIGGAWIFKRYTHLPTAGKGLVTVLGGASVGPRERVVVLKVDNTRLVVGVAPGQVRTLHVLDAQPDLSFEARLAEARPEEGQV